MPTSEAMARDDDCVARQRRISLQRSEDHEGQRRQRAERDLEDGAGADQALGACDRATSPATPRSGPNRRRGSPVPPRTAPGRAPRSRAAPGGARMALTTSDRGVVRSCEITSPRARGRPGRALAGRRRRPPPRMARPTSGWAAWSPPARRETRRGRAEAAGRSWERARRSTMAELLHYRGHPAHLGSVAFMISNCS